MTPSRTIARTLSTLHPIGTALTDTATILTEIRDELPKRGRLVDLHLELCEALAHVERTYRDSADALLTAYRELEHHERSTREGWTAQPLTNGNGHQ